MRDWNHHDSYLNELAKDIYPQPEDEGHRALAKRAIDTWMSRMTTCKSVLDLGCGTGFCEDFFRKWNVEYEGICLGEDVVKAQELGRNVKKMDFSFLEYPDSSFDLLFARHSFEHVALPLTTLMEWRRVSRQWLGLIVPAPEWYGYGYHERESQKNHYFILRMEQIENILDKAGWKILWKEVDSLYKSEYEEIVPHEYWIMSEIKK